MKYLPPLLMFVAASLCGCPGEEGAQVNSEPTSQASSTEDGDGRDRGVGDGADGPGMTDPAAQDSEAHEGAVTHDIDEAGDGEPAPAACCAAHDTPGCADPAIMDCVCADDVLPTCCTEAWTDVCVEIVRQRHCDPGVRACVCEEWEQSGCCQSDWTQTFCDVVATTKCQATIGCQE